MHCKPSSYGVAVNDSPSRDDLQHRDLYLTFIRNATDWFLESLVAQRLDRVKPRGFPRRIETKHNAHPTGHRDGNDDGGNGNFSGPMLEFADQYGGPPANENA